MKNYKMIILLFLTLWASAFGESKPLNDTNQFHDITSNLSDRLRYFDDVSRVDSEQSNNNLVVLLDSTDEGEKIGDELFLPTWHQSLIILVERFPEAGVSGRPIAYTREDVSIFKAWWSKNANRIKYHDNTHSIVGNAGFVENQSQSSTPDSSMESAKESPKAPTPIQSSIAPFQQPKFLSPSIQPRSVAETKIISWPWIIGAILLLVIAGGILLKLRCK